jgi:hypothetical protein
MGPDERRRKGFGEGYDPESPEYEPIEVYYGDEEPGYDGRPGEPAQQYPEQYAPDYGQPYDQYNQPYPQPYQQYTYHYPPPQPAYPYYPNYPYAYPYPYYQQRPSNPALPIVGGALSMVSGVIVFFFGAIFSADPLFWGFGPCLAILLVMGAIIIMGSICAIMKRLFPLAILGAIIAIFVPPYLLGLIAVILIAISHDQFQPTFSAR